MIKLTPRQSQILDFIKRSERGARVETNDGRLDVRGFPVDVVNTVGAGDSFASGLIRSRIDGLDWPDAVRFANACGAITVARHGCSAAFPSRDEVDSFITREVMREHSNAGQD